MSNFKTIEKLGLKVHNVSGLTVVSADSLEVLLQSAQVVYGTKYKNTPDESEWATHQLSQDTHSALLVGITPIKKKTKAEAALEFVSEVNSGKFNGWKIQSVQTEAKRILEMKD